MQDLRRWPYGDVAQLGERGVRNAEVGGSSPPVSTKPILSHRGVRVMAVVAVNTMGSFAGLDPPRRNW